MVGSARGSFDKKGKKGKRENSRLLVQAHAPHRTRVSLENVQLSSRFRAPNTHRPVRRTTAISVKAHTVSQIMAVTRYSTSVPVEKRVKVSH